MEDNTNDYFDMDGKRGRWYVVDSKIIENEELYLLKNEGDIYLDETEEVSEYAREYAEINEQASIIVDKKGTLLLDHVFDGFKDYEKMLKVYREHGFINNTNDMTLQRFIDLQDKKGNWENYISDKLYESEEDLNNAKNEIDKIDKVLNDYTDSVKIESFKEIVSHENVVGEEMLTTKEKIVDLYFKEDSLIKHISDTTASVIDEVNKSEGRTLSLKEIKDKYKEIGMQLENGSDKELFLKFKALSEIVNDLKHVQLVDAQEIAKTKMAEKNLTKSKGFEI